MVSFGNASGSLEDIDVKKSIQPKGLVFYKTSYVALPKDKR